MKIKLLVDSKILLSFFKARVNGFKGSYSDFVNGYVSHMITTKGEIEGIEDIDNSNIYKLTTLVRNQGEYVRSEDTFYLERPSGMTQEEVFKVIAYNREFFEKYYSKFNKSITELTNKALVNMFGFSQISSNDIKGRRVIELFFLKDYDMYFVNSNLYDQHFFWYEENIGTMEEEIIDIYDRINSNIARKLKNGE